VVLRGKGASQGTILVYTDALRWWKTLTGDPPLAQIDDYTVSAFAEGLRSTRYRRGKLGEWRALTEDSIAKHLRTIRAVLYRIGPTRDPARPAKELVHTAPLISVPKVEQDPKPTFSLAQARRIVEAAQHFRHPDLPGLRPYQWWRGFLGTLYVSGFRPGTARLLEWPMLKHEEDGFWLMVPSRLVPKTKKGTKVALPSWLGEMLANWPRMGLLIFPYPRHKDTLGDDHKALQLLAGMAEDATLELKAWRRFHGDQLERLGIGLADKIGQQALDHGDSVTTKSHYVNLVNELRRRLPCLWDEGPVQRIQRRLF
jgi:hypothetical protein